MNQRVVRIYTAAYLFSIQPKISVTDLAALMETTEDVVCRMARSAEWDDALDALAFTGERKFQRQPRREIRENGDTLQQAYTLIDQLIQDGFTEAQAVTRTAQMLKIPRRRVFMWNKRKRK